MNLNDLIELLEDIRDEHGGLITVEEANSGQLLYEDEVRAVDLGDGYDHIWVVQIG